MPAVCSLADRQQVSLGVLFTVVAFHLGLKSMDVYPNVPYIMFIDRVFLLNMLVMALCVIFNGVSYAFHGTCKEEDDDYETRSKEDWILLGVIVGVWILSNLKLFYSVIPGWLFREDSADRTGAAAVPEKKGKLTSISSYRWPSSRGIAPAS